MRCGSGVACLQALLLFQAQSLGVCAVLFVVCVLYVLWCLVGTVGLVHPRQGLLLHAHGLQESIPALDAVDGELSLCLLQLGDSLDVLLGLEALAIREAGQAIATVCPLRAAARGALVLLGLRKTRGRGGGWVVGGGQRGDGLGSNVRFLGAALCCAALGLRVWC